MSNSARFAIGMISLVLGIVCAVVFVNRLQADEEMTAVPESVEVQSWLDYPFVTITGDTTSLRAFQGKVVLLVNVASHCGNTPQYAGLQELQNTYGNKGFTVIGFPANDFMGQESGSNAEILEFCTTQYHVTFPMMAKISVKGKDIHPVYRYLTERSDLAGEITWNFNKFLLDQDGNVVARFDTKDQPRGGQIEAMIKQIL